ncbi:DNA polymerase [Sporomusa ovata]|nr:DNA polymerase [Sporomusa ovata]
MLSLDVETFSSINLVKAGVYKYTSAPDFEVLLLAYAFDDEEVQIIDLASGEELPTELMEAIINDSVKKTTFNANFERTCLAKHLKQTLSPVGWHCTAVQAASLGLPLSLEGVALVLGLEQQKMKDGKELIRFFSLPCKPTIANGGRTRNLPHHAADRWEQFKAYCVRDVEVERAIRTKIAKFPIRNTEQELYILDQRINDRGLLVDRELVKHAIECDRLHQTDTFSHARHLTGLENPNSVAQLKMWLRDNGVEVDSLSKKAVTDLAKESDGEVEALLNMRLQLAKTSIKKYEAIERSVCSDSRVRGLLQFYGANRTGRWCLTGDHEVLTQDGWTQIDSWNSGYIACWSPQTECISFQKAQAVSFDYDGDIYAIESQRCSQMSTPDHRMAYWGKNGGWEVDTVENLASKRFSIPFTGRRIGNSSLEHIELRILIMTQADGHYTQEGSLRFHFSKPRKIERCKNLLRKAGIIFMTMLREKSTVITIKSRHLPVWLRMFQNKTFGSWLFDESADIVFDELENWDGYRCGPNSIQYVTINKQNADMIQAFAHLSGRAATIVKKVRENWSDAYYVNIWLTPGGHNEIRKKATVIPFSGKVFCAETETGFFLVRRNGKVWITGNSGRLVQVQNLPQNHEKDLTLARDLLKQGRFGELKLFYESVPHLLSELIRTAFIPKENHRFIVADFSAIEARVIAWLAGEKWRMDVFKTHGKIYEASASQMFKVPLEDITKGSLLRQKGKIAELALGYGGGVGALTAMGALDMGLLEEELQPLVTAWRAANPNITKLWWDIDKAALVAVKDKTLQTVGRLQLQCMSGILFITLPSGRKLSYIKPRIELNKFGRDGITYEGIGVGKRWCRMDTYGPKLVENIVQGAARDLLAEAMLLVAKAGYDIVMHVHDEVVVEVPNGQGSIKEVCDLMAIVPPWAEGLPLRADGYECEYYRKD